LLQLALNVLSLSAIRKIETRALRRWSVWVQCDRALERNVLELLLVPGPAKNSLEKIAAI
jgi:hypothetical protein